MAHTVPLGKEVSQGTHGKQRYPDTVEEQQLDRVRLKLACILAWGNWGSLEAWSFEQKLLLRFLEENHANELTGGTPV